MHIAWAMMHVENLTRLGDGGEQWIIAAGAFLLLVETHRGALRVTPSALHRAIEVRRHSSKPELTQAFEDEVTILCTQVRDAAIIGPRERPAHRGDFRQMLEPQQPLDHLVIVIVLRIAKLAESQQQMHNQHHHDDRVTVNLAAPEVAEAMPQLLLQSEFGEQALEDDQPRERGQLLRLETHI